MVKVDPIAGSYTSQLFPLHRLKILRKILLVNFVYRSNIMSYHLLMLWSHGQHLPLSVPNGPSQPGNQLDLMPITRKVIFLTFLLESGLAQHPELSYLPPIVLPGLECLDIFLQLSLLHFLLIGYLKASNLFLVGGYLFIIVTIIKMFFCIFHFQSSL